MKLLVKIFLLLGFCIILSSPYSRAATVNQDTQSNKDGSVLWTKKAFPIASIKAVNVTTSGGSISVTGDANQEAVLEMYVKPNRSRNLSRNEIQEILDRDYEIEIEQRNGTLYVNAKKKWSFSGNNSLSISFKISTANQVTTELSTSGGNIQLANVSGKQSFKTSGGSLKIENIKGDISGKTSGGSIQAYNGQGTINLTTSGGSIKLGNLDGKVFASTSGGSIKGQQITGTLNAKTSGGSISLDDMACTISASTSGGSVTANLTKLVGGMQLSTSAGSINLTLPKSAAADLNLKGSKVNTSGLSNFNGSNNKGRLIGSINGGGVSINASTSAGNVNLNFR
jgi:hypothetical protein